MHGHLPTPAEMDAPGRVEESRELGEAVALVPRCDRGELVAEILRE
jgi:hypothetical protein